LLSPCYASIAGKEIPVPSVAELPAAGSVLISPEILAKRGEIEAQRSLSMLALDTAADAVSVQSAISNMRGT
jgi:hypothetical protein